MKAIVIFLAALASSQAAVPQNADDYRGGWKTDGAKGGEPHTYEFSIRGEEVHLLQRCNDACLFRRKVRR